MDKKIRKGLDCEAVLTLLDEKGPNIQISELMPEYRRHLESCRNCQAYYKISSEIKELAAGTEEVNLYNRFVNRKVKQSRPVWRPVALGSAAVLTAFVLTLTFGPFRNQDNTKASVITAALSSSSLGAEKTEKEYNNESSDLEYYTEIALEI